jgi:hypothetical protein
MNLMKKSYGVAVVLGATVAQACREARKVAATGVGLALGLATVGLASATDPLLPDTGIDIAAMVGEVVTTLGTIVAVIVAAFFAFLLIRKALKWARTGF